MRDGLPADLRAVLPKDTAQSWLLLREVLAETMVLYGGTALAAHLHHRVSRDLDFFFDDPDVDLSALRVQLESIRPLAVSTHTSDTLNATFGGTKVQFLHARAQDPVDTDTVIAGLRVASVRDIAATKIKVIGDRGELRDYYDLMVIEERTGVTVESALVDFQVRYRTIEPAALGHIVMALGYLDDVTDDPALPVERQDIERYWHRRQPAVVRSLPTLTDASLPVPPRASGPVPLPLPGGPAMRRSGGDQSGGVWVDPHIRDGHPISGYWRRR